MTYTFNISICKFYVNFFYLKNYDYLSIKNKSNARVSQIKQYFSKCLAAYVQRTINITLSTEYARQPRAF